MAETVVKSIIQLTENVWTTVYAVGLGDEEDIYPPSDYFLVIY